MNRLMKTAALCSAALVVILMATAAQPKRSRGCVAVPAVTGLAAADAKAAVRAAGLVPKFHLGRQAPAKEKALTVSAQDPAPGTSLKPGSPVQITVYAPSGKGSAVGQTGPQLTRVLVTPSLHAGEEAINPLSGELSVTVTDLVVPAGLVRLEVRRALQAHGGSAGLLGSRWRLNWERRLVTRGKKAMILGLAQERSFESEKAGQRFQSAAGDSLVVTADRAVWTTPDGATEVFDARGRLIEHADHNGNRIVLRYDAAGHLTRVEGPYNSFLQFVTNAAGRLTRVEASTGATVRYFYGDETPTAQQAAKAHAIGYSYDASGALVRMSHPQFGTTHFTHDRRGRVTSRRWADGAEERFEHKDATHTWRAIDPAGGIMTTRSSPDGRLIEVIDPLGRKSVIESDDAGRPLVVTGPTGLRARFTYDALGRLVSVRNSATGTTRFGYLGRTRLPAVVTAPDGRLSFTYDGRQNLLRITSDTDRAAGAAFTYFPDGLVKSVATGDGQRRSFTYDAAGRRASVTDTAGNTWRFEYDGQGNLRRTTDPLGRTTARTYDADNRLTCITDPTGARTRFQ